MQFALAPQPRAIAKAAGLRQFFPGRPCRNGHVTWWWVSGGCVTCSNERKAAWVQTNRARARAYGQAHYRAQETVYKARAATWKAENPERVRELEKGRAPNVEKRRAAERRRRQADPERFRAQVRCRKAQRRGAEGFYTVDDIAAIYRMQGGRCAYCPTLLTPDNQETDHITAITNGGSNWPSNLQLTCRPCNRSKSAKDPITFAQERGFLL